MRAPTRCSSPPVTGVLAGFATIGIIIGVGLLLAHLKILDTNSQSMLSRLTFFVASPALMVTVLGSADVHGLFSTNLIASVAGVAVTAMIQILTALLIPPLVAGTWRMGAGSRVAGGHRVATRKRS